eukprot:COSAG01_NODE_15718_length_1306_cov_9.200497_2_plen_75_part_01
MSLEPRVEALAYPFFGWKVLSVPPTFLYQTAMGVLGVRPIVCVCVCVCVCGCVCVLSAVSHGGAHTEVHRPGRGV